MSDLASLRGFCYSCLTRRFKFPRARAISFALAILLLWASAAIPKNHQKNWTDQTLNSLDLRDKIAQLVQVRVPGKFINRRSPEFEALKSQIQKNHIGGVVLFAGNIYESAILLNELQSLSRLPLLVSADFERGVSFRIADTTSFPWTMAIGAAGSEQFAFDQGYTTGKESRALGVHWIFAPVVDVNNNPENPVINIRSFGEDPGLVARLGSAFIRGAKKAGVMTTAKHFPGHGDTATDSHIGLAVVKSDIARLNAVEFVPFRSAIESGVDSIMTAHVAVPNLTGLPDEPATLSPKILTDVLRNTLKFDGIIVTDALEMGGITNSYWSGLAAVRALKAGADVLLLPTDATVAINEVERAVKRGEISEQRIDQSVRKILTAKARMGLSNSRTVPLDRIADVVASPQSAKLAQDIADSSITVLKDNQRLLPVNPLQNTRIFSLVLASDLESSPGAAFQAELRRRYASVRTAWANARLSEDLLAGIDKSAADSDLIICSTIVRLSSGQDVIGVPRSQQVIIKKLIASGKPVIWIAFGNPYVLRFAPEASTYMCTFSYSDVSQISAAKVLSGAIAALGKMPISIPGHSGLGDGLQIPRLPMVLQEKSEGAAEQSKTFQNTNGLVDSLAAEGVLGSSELMVGHRNRIALHIQRNVQGGSGEREIPCLAQVTRTISAAMLAADSGILLPGSAVGDYLPELQSAANKDLRVADLLSAFSRDGSAADELQAELVESVVERASGVGVEEFLSNGFFDSLGLTGSFGNIRNMAAFAQMLLNRGFYDHRRYLKPEIVSRYTGNEGMWSKPADTTSMGLFSPAAFGITCRNGSFFWIDPARELFIIFTANSITDGEVPRKIAESILSDLN